MRTDLLDYYTSRFILTRFERYHDVDGAPFKIGQRVSVLNNPNDDETFDKQFVGFSGKVVFFEFDCGCGQSFPLDPMIGVEFDNELVAEFWSEELESIL